MIKRSLAATLSQMVQAIRNVQNYTAGLSFEEFRQDSQKRQAVERCIEIISEAARRLPSSVQESHPELPWREIKGIGNILRHSYDEIDVRVVWSIVEEHITPLETTLIQIAREHGIELPSE